MSCHTAISLSGNAAYSKSKHGVSAAVQIPPGLPALTGLQRMQVQRE